MHLASSRPRSPSPAGPLKVRAWSRLSFRQAVATLAIALAIGIAGAAWTTVGDYHTTYAQAKARAQADIALVHGTAVEAAYQLSTGLARTVVTGLGGYGAVTSAVLSDNYGNVLARFERPPVHTLFPRLARRLFGDVTVYSVPLTTRTVADLGTGNSGKGESIGTLSVRLDSGWLLDVFLSHLDRTLWRGVMRAVLLAAAVLAVFYALITKPLLRITSAISAVNPARPGAFSIDVPDRHDRDELGLLVRTVNTMLTQSQARLDERDAAQAELSALARDLEARVAQRTHDLEREKAGLNRANHELERANLSIQESMRYAQHIQKALLPAENALGAIVAEMAVGWMPLEIVGGDYYWFGKFGDKGVIAILDCTGHGVPGAFMSAIAASALDRTLRHHDHDDPAVVLATLNRLVKSALRQDETGGGSNDGMDGAVCVLDPQARTVTFAGAAMPLVVAGSNGVRTWRGDRMSLGYAESPADYRFTTHRIAYEPGDAFYLFTDGVSDQIGGPNRRLLGRKRLTAILADLAGRDLASQRDLLFRHLAEWRGPERQRDDMTFVAFRPR